MTLVPQKRSIVWVQEIFESTDPFRLRDFIQFKLPFDLRKKSLRNITKRFELKINNIKMIIFQENENILFQNSLSIVIMQNVFSMLVLNGKKSQSYFPNKTTQFFKGPPIVRS